MDSNRNDYQIANRVLVGLATLSIFVILSFAASIYIELSTEWFSPKIYIGMAVVALLAVDRLYVKISGNKRNT